MGIREDMLKNKQQLKDEDRLYEKEAPEPQKQVSILDIWKENLMLMRANRIQDILVIDRMMQEMEELNKRNA